MTCPVTPVTVSELGYGAAFVGGDPLSLTMTGLLFEKFNESARVDRQNAVLRSAPNSAARNGNDMRQVLITTQRKTSQISSGSIHIPQIPLFGLHQRRIDVISRGFRLHGSLFLSYSNQRLMHVFGHPLGVPANIKVRPLLQPGPKLSGIFQHALLHVNLLLLIARKGDIKAVQVASFLIIEKFGAVEKVRRA